MQFGDHFVVYCVKNLKPSTSMSVLNFFRYRVLSNLVQSPRGTVLQPGRDASAPAVREERLARLADVGRTQAPAPDPQRARHRQPLHGHRARRAALQAARRAAQAAGRPSLSRQAQVPRSERQGAAATSRRHPRTPRTKGMYTVCTENSFSRNSIKTSKDFSSYPFSQVL